MKKFTSIIMAMILMIVCIPFTASVTAFAGVDDYPQKYKNCAVEALVVDEWHYYARQCTSFVAWRLNSRNGIAFHNWYGGVNFGNASSWGSAARSIGITVDMNPAVGSVYWEDAGCHVAWVEAVNGDNVTIEEYNWPIDNLGNTDGLYHRRTIPKSRASGYIHFKDIDTTPKGHVMSESEAAGQTIPDGDYWIYSKLDQNYFVDIPGAGICTTDETNVSMWIGEPLTDEPWDVWTITYLNNGFYSIRQKGGTKCIDVYFGSLYSGANVFVYEFNGTEPQQWSIKLKNGGYSLQARCNSFFLDVSDAKVEKSTNVQVWEENDSNAQLWEFIPFGVFEGSGTKNNPYQISSADDLRRLSEYINNENTGMMYYNKYYIQTADIDLENEIFTPIGKFLHQNDNYIQHTAFNGTYDGNGHKITGLNAQNDSFYYVGLFGRTNKNSVIKNLSVYGNVTGTQWCTGGIAGEVGYGGKVYNCSFNGKVKGAQMAGGITSSLQGGGTVSGCYVNATVTSPMEGERVWAGGIVGRPHNVNVDNAVNIEISNCYFVGEVSGEAAGDIVGKTVVDDNSKTKYTYSGNYYLKREGGKASGDDSVTASGAKAISESMMKNIDEILGEPFVHNDSKSLNNGYPVFPWQAALKGDINNDGKVAVADLVLLKKWLLTETDTLPDWKLADVCEDGVIDVYDVVALRKLCIG